MSNNKFPLMFMLFSSLCKIVNFHTQSLIYTFYQHKIIFILFKHINVIIINEYISMPYSPENVPCKYIAP